MFSVEKTKSSTPYKVIGLMSGTSVDGIDAALLEIGPADPAGKIRLLAFNTFCYPAGVREQILEVSDPRTGTVDRICRLNFLLGELFAEAAQKIAHQAQLELARIDLIGSHGQTIQHLPQAEPFGPYSQNSTLQIGEPSVIAERTGITTVADFRPGDMAAGGQGAPLLPYLHYILFKDYSEAVIVQNIGGIANLTLIPHPADPDEVIAFDTGPGNMLIDGIMGCMTRQRLRFDRQGAWAARGKLIPELLEELMAHPYLEKPPPKSTGREEFGCRLAEKIYQQALDKGLVPQDVVHTLTRFSARSIALAYQRFILPQHQVSRVYVAGGGSLNHSLMSMLAEEIQPLSLHRMDELGFPDKAVEAMGFAVLAYETMRGRPNNLPSVTGARSRVVLGKVVWGRAGRYAG
jgi:anhydro-N-acetylmuramic acid kinase